MKTDIRKKIQELEEKRISLLVKEADSALEKLFKEHNETEVRLVKDPHESEDIEAVTAPGIRFMQDGHTFRFTRFALVNKIVQAKVQEVVSNGDEEIFLAESDWAPLYMLKKDDDIDINSVQIDKTVQWLADDNYAWEFNQHIGDMWNDDEIDPFDKPYAECTSVEITDETSVEETETTDEDLVEALGKLGDKKYDASEDFNKLVWTKGISVLIDRMKEYGIRRLPIEQAAPIEDIWGFVESENAFMALTYLELDSEDNLYIVCNEVIKPWGSDGTWVRDYSKELKTIINEELSALFLPNIIEGLLTHTDIYEGEREEEIEEEEEEDFVSDNNDNDQKLKSGDSGDSIDLNNLLKVASSKEFQKEIHSFICHHLNKEHFTIAIGVEEDELIFRCLKQFDDDESFDQIVAIMTKYFGQTLPFYSINDLDFIEEEPELLNPITDDISTWVDDWNKRVVIKF